MASTPIPLGVSYLPSFSSEVTNVLDLVDFVEISPETLCREIEAFGRPRMSFDAELLSQALRATENVPIVVHGVELSIGTAQGWNDAYLEILDEFRTYRNFLWHSEHLAFQHVIAEDGTWLSAGLQLPLPFTEESVQLVAPRARLLKERYGVPFLLENATHYLPDLPRDPKWDEITFLNRLVEESDCDLLLDLFNLHCNAVNFGFDAKQALTRLRLDRVVEIHVAGGETHDGFLLDSHSDAVPDAVLELLHWIVPRVPRLAGVVYEVIEQAFPALGTAFIREQLERVRETLQQAK